MEQNVRTCTYNLHLESISSKNLHETIDEFLENLIFKSIFKDSVILLQVWWEYKLRECYSDKDMSIKVKTRRYLQPTLIFSNDLAKWIFFLVKWIGNFYLPFYLRGSKRRSWFWLILIKKFKLYIYKFYFSLNVFPTPKQTRNWLYKFGETKSLKMIGNFEVSSNEMECHWILALFPKVSQVKHLHALTVWKVFSWNGKCIH